MARPDMGERKGPAGGRLAAASAAQAAAVAVVAAAGFGGGDRDDRGDRGDARRRGRRTRARLRPAQGLPLLRREGLKVDYKDQSQLKYFLTERGKIIPRRISGNCAKHQRDVATAIKRARDAGHPALHRRAGVRRRT